MRIGLTGGTGFIGQYLIRDYSSEFEFVAPTSRKDFSGLEQGCEYIASDYSKSSFLRVFDGCDAVIHLGSQVMHGLDAAIEPGVYLPNIPLANDVFSACRELGIKNIVNASSVAVYQQINERPTVETDPCYPNSVYGIMKITVEKLAALYNAKYDMAIKSLRYGQGIGWNPRHKANGFWGILLDHCVSGSPIPIWGEGRTGRDVIYVKDMAYAAICAVGHPEARGEYNIGTQHICSNREIAEIYCVVFHNEAGLTFVPNTKEPGIRTCMDCSKAARELGYTAQYTIRQAVEDIYRERLLQIEK